MKKLYLLFFTCLVLCNVLPLIVSGQCGSFSATTTTYESRCTATGSIKVRAIGGSGNYKYKANGPVNTNFTSTDSITGLAAGTYVITVTDITTNCSVKITGVVVNGTYLDPRFTLNSQDVSCDNGNNGSISLATQNHGRAPFTYTIIAPSPTGIGTTNASGTFNNLSSGIYTIRLTDSCGGIQTRIVTINNYTWKIDSVKFNKISCDSAAGYIRVSDNRGNVSTITGMAGFTYGIVRAVGDTLWSNVPSFTFYLGNQNNFDALVKDPCGKIKKFPVVVSFNISVAASVNIFNRTCRQFSANVTGVTNFFSPTFCLKDNNGIDIACNTTGVFTGINYGRYCITAHDSCTDTTISRCFTVLPVPASVNNDVLISNKVCAGFTASITGQNGLTNPDYCLYDSLNNLVVCNATGVFNNLTYGNYCINITDTCRDTTIQRCFSVRKPVPVIPPIIPPSYYTCSVFGVAVTGDSLTSPLFCLIDTAGNIITCNNTGVFDSLAYGDYCISMYDSCSDTTITRCISVAGPNVINTYTYEITNRACSTFSATIFNSSFLGPQYCLYRADSSLIACNSTGIFDTLAYGDYYIIAHNNCPDTSFIYNIAAYPPLPSLDVNVAISNRACATFSVAINGQQNLTNPQYCLYDSANVLIACNATGAFANIGYGKYCIETRDGCYDTVIRRCFTAAPLPVNINITSIKSCNYGYAILRVTVAEGVAPYTITVLNPDGTPLSLTTYTSSPINIDSVPELSAGQLYTIIASDNCGSTDTDSVMAVASVIAHQARVIAKCPSSSWVNGSGSIETTASSNTGTITVRIIKKNNVTISSISPSNTSGAVSTFNNLGPGSYIIRYRINDGCNKTLYDTVTVSPYEYPSLERSSAYQCDYGGFSIGAVVSNGVGPFLYEIISSTPSAPSITTAPQSNPVFTINNGMAYSLVRLRAVDACGNASLEDASILPLANNGIISDYNCFQIATTLRVDTLYNSSYSWYRKHTLDDTDSTLMGNSFSLFFPEVLPADTGLYVCHVNVNSGCIKRTYYYRLDGSCFQYLPVNLTSFDGRYNGDNVLLNWQVTGNSGIKIFTIEKKYAGRYKQCGRIDVPVDVSSEKTYSFNDSLAGSLENYYRLKIMRHNNTTEYSKVILVSRNKQHPLVSIYPNPVDDQLIIELKQNFDHRYTVKLSDQLGRVVREMAFNGNDTRKVLISKSQKTAPGLYIINITDLSLNTTFTQKIIFR